ncbi:hypothetical protein Glove_60g24 [Diversispora epigaea]|uniref:Uncharacterized protein n=1 Tax=Diversispora epigaea TaxID=1348612 RepID=A0A397JIF5_9GLOM|nr:hypothetical protein Glove_60g24 [Diversispora epigaea]
MSVMKNLIAVAVTATQIHQSAASSTQLNTGIILSQIITNGRSRINVQQEATWHG